MNKKQKHIAEEVIFFLKKDGNYVSKQTLYKNISGLSDNKFPIMGGLRDRKLIADIGAGKESVRLTEKGWDFNSFVALRQKKLYKSFRRNISFVLNVFFIIVTITLSVLNFTISGKNKELTEKQLKLEGELNRMDVQLDYLLKHQSETSLLDTIK